MTPRQATRHTHLVPRWLVARQGWFFFPSCCSKASPCTSAEMPLVPAELRLDFLRRQVLMSRTITGGRVMSIARPQLRHLAPW